MENLHQLKVILEQKKLKEKEVEQPQAKHQSSGLLKRDGKVYVEIVKNCTKEQLIPIIQGKILEGSTT